jgi:hypothetical protein
MHTGKAACRAPSRVSHIFDLCSMRRGSGLSQLVFLLVVTTMVALAPALRAEACPTGYTEWDNNNNQCGKQTCIAWIISYSGICFVHHHHVAVDLAALDWGLPQSHTVPIPSSHARTPMITDAHPRTPTGVHRSVCAIGYGSYMKNASTSDGSLSSVPPTCHVLPKSGPDDSCHCVACPHGYGSRGGAINRAECIPQLHFYLRLTLATTEATPACNPAVSAAVTQALADALRKHHDILPGDSSADFLGCCSDSQVCCWQVSSVFKQACVHVRAQIHYSRVHTHT